MMTINGIHIASYTYCNIESPFHDDSNDPNFIGNF